MDKATLHWQDPGLQQPPYAQGGLGTPACPGNKLFYLNQVDQSQPGRNVELVLKDLMTSQ